MGGGNKKMQCTTSNHVQNQEYNIQVLQDHADSIVALDVNVLAKFSLSSDAKEFYVMK